MQSRSLCVQVTYRDGHLQLFEQKITSSYVRSSHSRAEIVDKYQLTLLNYIDFFQAALEVPTMPATEFSHPCCLSGIRATYLDHPHQWLY